MDFETLDTLPAPREGQTQQNRAATVIQTWFKKVQLKKIASHYITAIMSLQRAQTQSYSALKMYIFTDDVQIETRKLFNHFNQVSAFLRTGGEALRYERMLLSAYLIVTQSKEIFEASNELNTELLASAQEMIASFEDLCNFWKHVRLHRMHEDAHQMFQLFYQIQTRYHRIYDEWSFNNRQQLVNSFIKQYLKIELTQLNYASRLNPKFFELNMHFVQQQFTLRKKVAALSGVSGLSKLEEELGSLQKLFEAKKWMLAPEEVVLHELALNPTIELSADACSIHPRVSTESILAGFHNQPIDLEPLFQLVEEVREHLSDLTPNNQRRAFELASLLGRQHMMEQIRELGVYAGLSKVLDVIIEKIKELESPQNVSETVAFQQALARAIGRDPFDEVLQRVVNFIYSKISQIIHGVSSYAIEKAMDVVAKKQLIDKERLYFQERLHKKQFNLSMVIAWIDNIVSTPGAYRIAGVELYSQHVASYVVRAILLGLVSKHGPVNAFEIPETLYLDRDRLTLAHAKYQQIFYEFVGMECLEIFHQRYGIAAGERDWIEQRNELLRGDYMANPELKEITSEIISGINRILQKNNQTLNSDDKATLTQKIEDSCKQPGREAIDKRLCDCLAFYLFKRRMPESLNLYGLEEELLTVCKSLTPLFHHHTKVHGAFYKNEVEKRLSKPLFVALRELETPRSLPAELVSAQEAIHQVHDHIHKMAYLLTGLSLILQELNSIDLSSTSKIQPNALKSLSITIELMGMVLQEDASKVDMDAALLQLRRQIADSKHIVLSEADEQKMLGMLRKAKNIHSPGAKVFLEELLSLLRLTTLHDHELSKNPVVAAFSQEISGLSAEVRHVNDVIRTEQLHDDHNPVVTELIETSLGMRIGA